jgi:hypothetical protein
MRRALALAATALLLSTSASAQHALVPGGPYDPAVPAPASVLGYEVGEHFTPHRIRKAQPSRRRGTMSPP